MGLKAPNIVAVLDEFLTVWGEVGAPLENYRCQDVYVYWPMSSCTQSAASVHLPSLNVNTKLEITIQPLNSRQPSKMSYYFAIIGTQDNPLFEYEFGTSKQGGDGIARFAEQARHVNQFIVHSSLDIVEEVQWGSGQM